MSIASRAVHVFSVQELRFRGKEMYQAVPADGQNPNQDELESPNQFLC